MNQKVSREKIIANLSFPPCCTAFFPVFESDQKSSAVPYLDDSMKQSQIRSIVYEKMCLKSTTTRVGWSMAGMMLECLRFSQFFHGDKGQL